MSEAALREAIVRWGKSLFDRGLTGGSSGNISVRIDDGFLATPTNSCLGFLDAGRAFPRSTPTGSHVSGDPPTKELPLHFAFYRSRAAGAGASCISIRPTPRRSPASRTSIRPT